MWFRLVVSLGGLAFLGVVLAVRGMPSGPSPIEVLAIPLVLFGGTLVWSARKLIRRDHSDSDAP